VKAEVLRILDANANRAREALRVMEEWARFGLNDQTTSAELKLLRHQLRDAVHTSLADSILWRDTPGDVGTQNTTPTEMHRHDPADVVIAAGKRLGEALRCLEEYSKIDNAQTAAAIAAIRYRAYDLEKRLTLSLRPAKRFANVRLCVLITESICNRHWLQVAEHAILGGADCLQLREKNLNSGELLSRAKHFVELCKNHKVLSIINDRPDIAILARADGVHVGQTDLPATEARKIIGSNRILGVSTHNIEHARQAVRDGADYIGAGPIYKSTTKTRDFVAGLDHARAVAKEIPIPALAIAGITLANVDEVIATGIHGIALTAAVIACDDVQAAARRFKEKLSVTRNASPC
jgi:thiamine-phosphate pyrophosphorylase